MKLICILMLICIDFSFSNCTNENKPPEMLRESALRLKNEMENLDRIPLREREILSDKDSGIYKGIIDYKQRAEYIKKHREMWEEIFLVLDETIVLIESERWKDDALFWKALGYLTMASNDNTNKSTNNAISSMNDFINIKQEAKIERWTKKQLKNIFWDKIVIHFNKSVSEKKNLDAFFYIGIASLLHKKGDVEKALEEYKKVLVIAKKGFFAQQARGQIELLNRQ